MKKRHSVSPKNSLAPKKSLGQNFLTSTPIRDRIIDACAITSSSNVVEIGPGKGILSKELINKTSQLVLVEKDRRMVEFLTQELKGDDVEIVQSDILKFDLANRGDNITLIGNIPYNISTPIIEYAIAHRRHIDTFFMTVQKEFGERLAAQPGGKDYGSLSIYAQYYADVTVLFKIKNTAFFPAPKVHSCFVRMHFRPPKFDLNNETKFFRFVQQTFTQRRKTILNGIPYAGTKEELSAHLEVCKISPKLRPESLRIDEFVKVFQKLDQA